MLIDGRTLADNSVVETHVAVIGGGVAGISLALEFDRFGFPACLVEAGGDRRTRRSQALYVGEVSETGDYDLASNRSRCLGGSSNCWAGWCRPFTDTDFAQRDWIPNSGWPFGPEALIPYHPRARAILELSDLPFNPQFWLDEVRERGMRLFPFDPEWLDTVISQFSPPARLGRSRRAELERSVTSKVILHATASNIATDPVTNNATGADVILPAGKKLAIKAKYVVIAAGGVENARLLLMSNKVQKEGLGNKYDVVGRYFMDHPRLRLGRLTLRDPQLYSRLYDVTYHYHNKSFSVDGTRCGATLGLSARVQQQERLTQCHTALYASYLGENWHGVDRCKQIHAAYKSLKPISLAQVVRASTGMPGSIVTMLTRATRMRKLVDHYLLESVLEPVPDRESRVTLSGSRDALGLPRTRLTWRVGEVEKRTHFRAIELIKREVEGRNLGRVELDGNPWDDGWRSRVLGTWHHMGTTRMHHDLRLGVVDSNCKVHGVPNLFVAGSSVFPTGGSNMPTFTIACLAVRLADHIRDLDRRALLYYPAATQTVRGESAAERGKQAGKVSMPASGRFDTLPE